MTIKINGRTPEEIKRGLECCNAFNACLSCPYEHIVDTEHGWGCVVIRNADTLAYIQQLERERDAAVEDIFKTCLNCKHEKLGYGVGPCPPAEEYVKMIDCCNWQWRGVQEAE